MLVTIKIGQLARYHRRVYDVVAIDGSNITLRSIAAPFRITDKVVGFARFTYDALAGMWEVK